jgi:predicted TIM-barrel fold metal-dependent hydrolase
MKNNIPLFDSLTHPTSNGKWIYETKNNNHINNLNLEFKKYNVKWAFAVNLESSDNKYYASYFDHMDNIFPIYYFDINNFESKKDIKKLFKSLRKKGYYGIKIHTRLSKTTINNKNLIKSIKLAKKYNLIVMLCTYFHSSDSQSYKNNELSLHKLLIKTNGTKIILLHGGLTKVLTYMEIIKPFKNVILDLSYTLIKYKDSSLEKDFEYIFKHFDRRICIGSDHPDYSIKQLRKRFNHFTKLNIDKNKLKNIAYKNLQYLLG